MVSASAGDLDLALPDARRSRRARRRSRRRRAPAAPAAWPRTGRRGARGEAIERMKTPGSVAWSCIRTRSPSSAPPENGDDGSTASTPTRRPARAAARATSAEVVVDLPTPGEPVSPTTWARPAYGASAAITSRSAGRASSTSEISRATARGLALARPPDEGGDVDGPATTVELRSASAPTARGRSGRRPGRRRRTAPPRRRRRRGA